RGKGEGFCSANYTHFRAETLRPSGLCGFFRDMAEPRRRLNLEVSPKSSSSQLPSIPTTPRWQRVVGLLSPSHTHTAFTAALLLMTATMASRVIGLVKTKYIAYLLG